MTCTQPPAAAPCSAGKIPTKIGLQMWRDKKIEKKFFCCARDENGITSSGRLRLALGLDRADLVTELLRVGVQASS
jgi:hypothetical protein